MSEFDERRQASADQEEPSGEAAVPHTLDQLGLSVEENPDGEGVVVTGVSDDSPASETDLRAGDVIVAVGDRSVTSIADVEEGISAAEEQNRDAVLFRVRREDGTRFVGVPLGRG